jgi:hypothetical protein
VQKVQISDYMTCIILGCLDFMCYCISQLLSVKLHPCFERGTLLLGIICWSIFCVLVYHMFTVFRNSEYWVVEMKGPIFIGADY